MKTILSAEDSMSSALNSAANGVQGQDAAAMPGGLDILPVRLALFGVTSKRHALKF